MTDYLVNGGNRLYGEVIIPSAKNAILPILAACLQTNGTCSLSDCPKLTDIDNMLEIIKSLGGTAFEHGGVITVDSNNVSKSHVSEKLARTMRSSVFLLGPLLSRFRHAELYLPGGCNIGARPIDLHIKALQTLGVKVEQTEDRVVCDATCAHSGNVFFDYKSVGATENLVAFAALQSGTTTLYNAALEPEVADLCSFLNACGAKIRGIGSGVLEIEGVKSLRGVAYKPIPDRITTSTYLSAVLSCGGELQIKNVREEHLQSFIGKIHQKHCKIAFENDILLTSSDGVVETASFVDTAPYPHFPTDMQSLMLSLMAVSNGEHYIVENVFDGRLRLADELNAMGADIAVVQRVARVVGVKSLHGAQVKALDLRGGAALVVAALAANGTTVIKDICHIERGYDGMHSVLRRLGADIRIEENIYYEQETNHILRSDSADCGSSNSK